MTSQILPTSLLQTELFHGSGKKETSGCGRYCMNWDKIVVLANSALIIAGIASAFFMKLPLLIVGLGAYGTVYLLLQTLATRHIESDAKERRIAQEQELEILDEKVARGREDYERIKTQVAFARKARRDSLTQDERARAAKVTEKATRYDALNEFFKVAVPRLDPSGEAYRFFAGCAKAMDEAL